MKKIIVVASALIVALSLSSCASGSTDNNFDKKVINTTPHWDITATKTGSWNSGSVPTPTQTAAIIDRVETDPSMGAKSTTPNQIDVSSTETVSYNFARLVDSKSKCTIEARIVYMESYKKDRGDLYNSKSYLYALVPSSENPVANEKIESFEGNSYAVGTYTMPKDLGNNMYHKTAVRTFSTPVGIVGASGFTKDELGNYNSDLTVGLPTVVFDMSCPTPDPIATSLWSDGVNKFKLSFDALPMPVQTVK